MIKSLITCRIPLLTNGGKRHALRAQPGSPQPGRPSTASFAPPQRVARLTKAVDENVRPMLAVRGLCNVAVCHGRLVAPAAGVEARPRTSAPMRRVGDSTIKRAGTRSQTRGLYWMTTRNIHAPR